MAIRLQRRAAPASAPLLAGAILALTVFVALFIWLRDWLAGAFALVAATGVARLVTLRRSRELAPPHLERQRADGETQLFVPATGRAFVTGACHVVGTRLRDGHLVIGREVAGFVPTTRWRGLAIEIVLGLIAHRVKLSEIELDADDSPSLASELEGLVGRRGGFLLGDDWSWTRRGKALARSHARDYLTIEDDPPAAFLARWPVLRKAPAAEQLRVRMRVLSIGGAMSAFAGAAGVVSWHLTGNSDFLIAGLGWAGVIAAAVTTGWLLARRDARREGDDGDGEV
jgi:hypothetical protein